MICKYNQTNTRKTSLQVYAALEPIISIFRSVLLRVSFKEVNLKRPEFLQLFQQRSSYIRRLVLLIPSFLLTAISEELLEVVRDTSVTASVTASVTVRYLVFLVPF